MLFIVTMIKRPSLFRVLKAGGHSVCVHCMYDVFSNKQIDKSYDAILNCFQWVSSKIKTIRHSSELQ